MPLFNPAKLSEQYATTFYLPSSITTPGLIPINNLLMSDGQGGTFYSDTLNISTLNGTSTFMNSINTQTVNTSTVVFNDLYWNTSASVYSSNDQLYYKNEQVTNASIKYKSDILDSTIAIDFENISLRVSVATLGYASFQIKTTPTNEFDSLNSGYSAYVDSGLNKFTQYAGESVYYDTTYKDIHEWTFTNKGDTAIFNIHDLTFRRMFRITGMIGEDYNSNAITIERLYP